MELVILSLLILSAVLFVLSFLRKDGVKVLEKEVEQLSLSYMQDMYQLNKKISILEEELLQDSIGMGGFHSPGNHEPEKNSVNEILKNQVLALYRQGLSVERISAQSTLSQEEILEIIEDGQHRGNRS
ncbi:hypothetical protein V1498_06550 [Peribacillus sp. SCS-26]|uniref:hypothetical protein n=1 Tax=Paraperibacillus marinus TaxID=3115295 RepID=UPI00390611A0